MKWMVSLFFFVMLTSFKGNDKDFVWRNVTNPYRNYVYPGQTGLRYYLNYNYPQESKALRRYLKSKYDVKSSASIAKIFKDVSSGVFFDRYCEVRFKYLESTDTIVMALSYASGESVIQQHSGIKGTRKFTIPLTNDKLHHDFATGTAKEGYKGLVVMIDVFVKRKRVNKNHVVVFTKVVTEADLPGIVSKIRGNRLIR